MSIIRNAYIRLVRALEGEPAGMPVPADVSIEQALLIEYARSGKVPASVWLDRLTSDPELFEAYQRTCRGRQQSSVIRMFMEKAAAAARLGRRPPAPSS